MAGKKPKIDPAHEETERIIKEMEKKISKEYAQAEKEVQAKLDDYFRRFRLKDEKWREWVANGTKTDKEYQQWRTGQMAVGKRWEAMKRTIAADYVNADKIARSIVKGYMPEVYAENFNYGTYEAEIGAKVNTSFTLYDRQTVERIMRDNPELLPAPGKKVSKDIAEGKAIRWNRQKVQSVMLQGIIQGESIPKLAIRLAKEVGDSDRKAAIRNARTMATGAQNAGRTDSYKRAEAMGINMQQEWRATLDMRTRHEHRQLDGQTQKVGEPFKVDGYEIMYPGDPNAPAYLVYNCRCTLRGLVKGLEPQARKYRDTSAIDEMSYDDWKNNKKSKSNPITSQRDKGEAIAESYRKEYRSKGLGANNNQLDLIAKHDSPKFVKTVDFDDQNQVRSVIEEFENEAKTRSIETARVITKEGKVYDCFGVKDAVFPNVDLGDEIVGGIISHNHPIDVTEFTFSEADISLFVEYKLTQLRGVDEKYTYILFNNSKEVDKQPDNWQNIENSQHSTIISFVKNLGLGYRRTKND